jgi:hypothetical protein
MVYETLDDAGVHRGRTLYITAETGVYRIRLDAAGF